VPDAVGLERELDRLQAQRIDAGDRLGVVRLERAVGALLDLVFDARVEIALRRGRRRGLRTRRGRCAALTALATLPRPCRRGRVAALTALPALASLTLARCRLRLLTTVAAALTLRCRLRLVRVRRRHGRRRRRWHRLIRRRHRLVLRWRLIRAGHVDR